MRAVYEIRPPAWGETLVILQSVSLPEGPERVRARVVDVDGERVTVEFAQGLPVSVDTVLPLADYPRALARLAAGDQLGKVVLVHG